MARAARAMAIAMRVAGNEEGNCNSDKGVRQGTAMAMRRAMAAAMRVAGEEESKGGKGDGNGDEGGGQ
jgi:hypothetical protein